MAEKKFKPRKTLRITAALMLLGLMVYGAIQLSRPALPVPLPNPNGYDDFVQAAQFAVGNGGDLSLSQGDLRELIVKNAEALRLVRQGLTRSCRVRVDFTAANFSPHMSDLAGMKRLVWLLVAEGRLAEMGHRTNDAIRIYLESIRFGQEASRGGLVIDRLVGIACQATGVEPLKRIVHSLHTSECHEAMRTLEKIQGSEESVEEIMHHEKEWSRRNRRLLDVIRYMIATRSFNPMQQTRAQLTAKMQLIQPMLDRLMIDLAVRAYELEHGQPPTSVNELVPDYLNAIPVDPATGTKLTYLPQSK